MNAVVDAEEFSFAAMTAGDLAEVMAIERVAYAHPWTEGNFADSLRAGYCMQLLRAADGALIGYFVAMRGVDEVHLLNITVAPQRQRCGWGRLMLDALAHWARGQGAQWLWLEVRVSNTQARRVYEAHGFRRVGERRGYYPAGAGRREDAIVMSLQL